MPSKLLPVYCIDTSALVDFKETHPLPIYPPVWKKLGELASEGRLITVDLVREECEDQDLAAWFSQYPKAVVGHTRALENCVKRVMADVHTSGKRFVDYDKGDSDADPFIIACAMACNLSSGNSFASGQYVLVQHEASANNSPKKVKIPDVCTWYGIRCMRIYDLIREEGWVFP